MPIVPFVCDNQPCRSADPGFYVPNVRRYNQLVPQDFFKNLYQPFENILRPIEQLSTALDQMALRDTSKTFDGDKFQVNIDVQHFSPDEINVKVVDNYITVEGKHEEKRDEHGYVSRQFVRRYPLPEGCLPDAVVSQLSSDGVLMVTAPKVLPLPSAGERIVPITKTGPVKRQVSSDERFLI